MIVARRESPVVAAQLALKFLAILVGKNGEGAGQSMSGGIAAGGSLSLGRRRPGAVRGVVLIGGDLSGGTHSDLRVAGEG